MSSYSACRMVIRPCSRRALPIFQATSALDPESEAIIQQHLGAIAHGRTIIIITHRLSFVARADAIIVVDQGRIAQVDCHDVLYGVACRTTNSGTSRRRCTSEP